MNNVTVSYSITNEHSATKLEREKNNFFEINIRREIEKCIAKEKKK